MIRGLCKFLGLLLLASLGHASDGEVAGESAPASERAAMDRAYAAWRSAMISRDVVAWEKATATSRKVATRNLMISQKHPFPKSLF